MRKADYFTQQTCLWCLEPKDDYYSLSELLVGSHPLCMNCRRSLSYKPKWFKVGDLWVYGLFEYDESFSRLLIQYKELGDIVLKSVFRYYLLMEGKFLFKRWYLIPSTKEKEAIRGFSHLKELVLFRSCEVLVKISGEQKKLGKEARSKVHFGLVSDTLLPGILFDDVCTTGSSLLEAKRILGDCVKCAYVLAYSKEL